MRNLEVFHRKKVDTFAAVAVVAALDPSAAAAEPLVAVAL